MAATRDPAGKPPFRSWAEDYPHNSRALPPVDREAFRIRAVQRANTQRVLGNNPAPKPTSRGQALRQLSDRAFAARISAETDRKAHAAVDPIEIARLHLQRRGLSVFRAHVVGGPREKWDVSGLDRWISDDELLDHAARHGLKLPTSKGNVDE